ncbi:MAG: TetR family transcriptional regulator C-terminal domain-containing protein [Candidatus Melainabacteria bacterium]|nr:TetR family transcriptional regulator C-terminal domain-containing protein [Candidatus Melainabacteria bacterium]OPZ91205.1 MAG: Transcriptional regulator AcuR [bacterium ADurb.Bin425]
MISMKRRGETRDKLIEAGLQLMLAKGYTNTGIQEIVNQAGVPKGSFYHYFDSKESFALAIIDSFDRNHLLKIRRHLSSEQALTQGNTKTQQQALSQALPQTLPQALSQELSQELPQEALFVRDDHKAACCSTASERALDRLLAYFRTVAQEKGDCPSKSGCLIGTLSQEMSGQSELLRARLAQALDGWRAEFSQCLKLAQTEGDVRRDLCPIELSEIVLSGWEGAILRSKATNSPAPLHSFIELLPRLLQIS